MANISEKKASKLKAEAASIKAAEGKYQ